MVKEKAKTKAVLQQEISIAEAEITALQNRIENISFSEVLEKKVKLMVENEIAEVIEDKDLVSRDEVNEIAQDEAQNVIDGASICT